jgi:putative DNA primase/helicase
MDKPKVHDVARGKWPGLLLGLGLSERQLSGDHCPCPVCGGEDRFRFDDKDGRGTFYCPNCGPKNGFGTGVDLVMALKGWNFHTTAKEIEQAAGVIKVSKTPKRQDEASKVEALKRVCVDLHTKLTH